MRCSHSERNFRRNATPPLALGAMAWMKKSVWLFGGTMINTPKSPPGRRISVSRKRVRGWMPLLRTKALSSHSWRFAVTVNSRLSSFMSTPLRLSRLPPGSGDLLACACDTHVAESVRGEDDPGPQRSDAIASRASPTSKGTRSDAHRLRPGTTRTRDSAAATRRGLRADLTTSAHSPADRGG